MAEPLTDEEIEEWREALDGAGQVFCDDKQWLATVDDLRAKLREAEAMADAFGAERDSFIADLLKAEAALERVREFCDRFPVSEDSVSMFVVQGPRPFLAAVRDLRIGLGFDTTGGSDGE